MFSLEHLLSKELLTWLYCVVFFLRRWQVLRMSFDSPWVITSSHGKENCFSPLWTPGPVFELKFQNLVCSSTIVFVVAIKKSYLQARVCNRSTDSGAQLSQFEPSCWWSWEGFYSLPTFNCKKIIMIVSASLDCKG